MAHVTSLMDSRVFHPRELAANWHSIWRVMRTRSNAPLLGILAMPAVGAALGVYCAAWELESPDVMITREQLPWESVDPHSLPHHMVVPHKKEIESLNAKMRQQESRVAEMTDVKSSPVLSFFERVIPRS